eukprot:TRINITY_DN25086_c0_g1_i1.p1 TRINITY_DN25086_c0_g1~~TRINITY_DN25086_c0_g1_i1.p1  ORF type:complete len:416 (-),score=77.04 TRINITY_DN25086_c0_g1_i1:543-1766(-)
MKRGYDDSGPTSQGQRRREAVIPRSRYCLKVLLPDLVVSYLLKNKGEPKEYIQEKSAVRLIFSTKGDYFPESSLRTVGIYADESQRILHALELMIDNMLQATEEDRGRPPPEGCEIRGEQEGHVIVRLCLSKQMTGHLIGSKGANITELRRETRVKILVHEDTIAGHRLATLTGDRRTLRDALQRVNDVAQQESDTDEFYQYAQTVNFRDGNKQEGTVSSTGASRSHTPSAPSSAPARPSAKALKAMKFLTDDIDSLPAGTPELSYSLACMLPAGLTPVLVGKAGEFVKSVEERTGAKVAIAREPTKGAEDLRKMECVGPLLSIYAAHALMMQRLQEIEPRDEAHPASGRVSDRSDWPKWNSKDTKDINPPPRAKDFGNRQLTPRQQELHATIADLEQQLADVMKEL